MALPATPRICPITPRRMILVSNDYNLPRQTMIQKYYSEYRGLSYTRLARENKFTEGSASPPEISGSAFRSHAVWLSSIEGIKILLEALPYFGMAKAKYDRGLQVAQLGSTIVAGSLVAIGQNLFLGKQ